MREPDEPAQSVDPLSDVEHDLVNSLASITGFGQLIRRDPSLPNDLRHSAGLLVEEAVRTRQLVQILLDTIRQRSTEPSTAAPPPAADAQDVATGTMIAARPKVVVLDDDPTLRIYLEKALLALGYEPVVALRGAEAVELAKAGDTAAILCDQRMLGMSGLDVYEAIVATRPDLARRFVMMSGDVLDAALATFAATHEMTRLAKPFDFDTLDRTLRSVIAETAHPRG